ncbi:ABC transporter permease [Alkaliphilus peptidifermentans]|uniref:ABC-2 type transport system permease protein n=1 Tax=Alkaliphilus peptidifermentans DSM 18978 TaxID=1120976 RepID=A0A1G5JSM7_9FIRM|nr:ABC transporter permease [Alkaliphilus peptidifermentans]SCY91403.1 ABC-2 type transport system permease protein [Alkaliphilus peptidifermentans DSM 18978]
MTVFKFVFKRYFRNLSNVIFLGLLPIAAAFLPIGGTPEWIPLPLGFQYYGLIQLLIAARLAEVIMEDRINKILLRIGVTPMTHLQYLWQNLLAFSAILTGVNVIVMILGIVVHGDALISPGLLFIIFTVFSMTSIGFALAWYSLFRNKETAFSLLGGVIILISMLGGVMWPIQIMPPLIQRLAMLLPTYWLMEGILIVVKGGGFIDLMQPLALMAMFSLGFIILGSRRRI